MSSCERCWSLAGGNVPRYRQRLIDTDEHNAVVCTAEQQAGPDAGECPVCKRMTAHQHTGELMCGCDYDPTPWCSGCGARRQADCKCGPIAQND